MNKGCYKENGNNYHYRFGELGGNDHILVGIMTILWFCENSYDTSHNLPINDFGTCRFHLRCMMAILNDLMFVEIQPS